MPFLSRSLASLALILNFLPFQVAASPAAHPQVTALAQLEKRANGANIIGYSSSGTAWRTRSCNNGFFSTSGSLGNCCVSGSCDFITACRSSYVFYAAGSSAFCGSTGVCGTGTVYHTIGDLSPVSVFNCESDWRATMTVTTSTTSVSTITSPSTVTSVSTTATKDLVTESAQVGAISLSSPAQVTSTSTSTSQPTATPVTLTVTNSNGQPTTQVTVIAAGASGLSSSASNTATATAIPIHNSSSSGNTGAIAGGVVGGIAVIALAAIGIFFLLRRKSNQTPAVPPANGPEYFAPTVGGQPPNDGQYPQGQPPQFSQLEYMNNTPAMAQNGMPPYQQNQAYGAYAPPMGMAGQQLQDYKVMPQQDYKGDGQRGMVETNVVPVGPPTPMAPPQGVQEVYGSPVPQGAQEVYGSPVAHPVEMPAHGR